MTACGTSKRVVREAQILHTAESRVAEARDSLVVAVRDTVKEATTVTVLLRQPPSPGAPPDTIRVTTVTNRDRISTQARHASGTRHVSGDRYMAPSLPVPGDRNLAPTWLAALKWLVALVVALGALVLIVKMKRV